MASIWAVVLTRNEEDKIKDCLKSLSWCSEIVVLDDNSTDKTIALATQIGAKVYKYSGPGDFSQRRNFALSKTKGDWVFFVDADERVSISLKDEIKQKIDNPRKNVGFYLKRQDYFFGKQLRFGETSRVRLLRLGKKDVGKWVGKVHEVWQIKGETALLENPLEHYPHKNINQFLTSINTYSSLRAEQLYQERKKTNVFEIILFPLSKFMLNYLVRLGFLDGVEGLIMALMMSFHSFLARAKLYCLNKKARQ